MPESPAELVQINPDLVEAGMDMDGVRADLTTVVVEVEEAIVAVEEDEEVDVDVTEQLSNAHELEGLELHIRRVGTNYAASLVAFCKS